MMTLDNVPKTLYLSKRVYHLRGTIVFNCGLRTSQRIISGHYKAFAYRSNGHWEMYDDLTGHVKPATKKHVNVEALLYTL